MDEGRLNVRYRGNNRPNALLQHRTTTYWSCSTSLTKASYDLKDEKPGEGEALVSEWDGSTGLVTWKRRTADITCANNRKKNSWGSFIVTLSLLFMALELEMTQRKEKETFSGSKEKTWLKSSTNRRDVKTKHDRNVLITWSKLASRSRLLTFNHSTRLISPEAPQPPGSWEEPRIIVLTLNIRKRDGDSDLCADFTATGFIMWSNRPDG